ncbi:MAG TPA: hypothetical protein DCQ31_04175 [Bacteroidales bacterium]|nr:hypothetical protein [Bacteroidales bacterium]
MKKLIPLLFFVLSLPGFSQIQVGKVLLDEAELKSVPTLTFDFGLPINITGPYAFMKSEEMFIESGLYLTTDRYVFDLNGNRFSHRSIGFNIPLRVGKIIKNKYYIGGGNNFNFPIHYRQFKYDAFSFNNKQKVVSEFFSDQIVKFYPSLELNAGFSTHGIGRFSIRVQMHFLDFFNLGYTENGVLPYEKITWTNRYKLIILSYNPGL